MSALDQAFIKAYAKDIPAAEASRAGLATHAPRRAAAPAQASATTGAARVEQMYHEGTLYRVEAPAAAESRRPSAPAPHFRLPANSAPGRNVRRRTLRLLGQQQPLSPSPAAPIVPVAPAPRFSRHAPHSAPAPQPAADLPPEILTDEPHAEPLPVKAAPAFAPVLPPLPAAPPVAPLNIAEETQTVECLGQWTAAELSAQPASLVCLPEPADLTLIETAPLVEVCLDSVEAAATLEDSAAAQPEYRLDAAHATPIGRSHLKFAAPPAAIEPEADVESPAPIAEQIENHLAAAEEAIDAIAADDLTFADLDPTDADATIAAAATGQASPAASEIRSAAPIAKSCIPVWEVDRFQWPVTVERLLTDKQGYFAQASGRLLAAVQGGLKLLAITGSRRGEGRTTLALCIARAAAKAGIQVAVIDADFARPQLATKIGLEVTYGWQEAALGKVPLSETAVKSLADHITILPLEASAAGADLSLADPRVAATLRAAVATFELVILDLGPLAGNDDNLFPVGEACPLDAAIVVRDLRYASLAESQAIGERLYTAGVEAVGIAENFAVEEESA
jgi:Mrp family chromosome partitioning ATPase